MQTDMVATWIADLVGAEDLLSYSTRFVSLLAIGEPCNSVARSVPPTSVPQRQRYRRSSVTGWWCPAPLGYGLSHGSFCPLGEQDDLAEFTARLKPTMRLSGICEREGV